MPIHDWTQVNAGIFHDFHHDWITMLKRALNDGRLPDGYYALAEQIAGGYGPDVLTLDVSPSDRSSPPAKGVALAACPPKVQFTAEAELDRYARKRDRVVVRHASGHQVVAMVEIVSPGNKASKQALRSFVKKAVELLDHGVHLLIVDLFPPSRRDPQGLHAAIWSEIEDHGFQLPEGKPLTLASYAAGELRRAFVQPVAVGDMLPEMALFLQSDLYVLVPLEMTYQSAWSGVPEYWRDHLPTQPSS